MIKKELWTKTRVTKIINAFNTVIELMTQRLRFSIRDNRYSDLTMMEFEVEADTLTDIQPLIDLCLGTMSQVNPQNPPN
jgi:hypothetical protein